MRSFGMKSFLVCSLCVAAISLNSCGNHKKGKNAEGGSAADSAVVRVVVADVTQGSFEDWGSYSADLRGIEDVTMTAPMQGGRVNSVKNVGSRVKAGESLCDIEGIKYDAALAAAVAQVELAQGDLERAQINVEKGSLGKSAQSGATLAYQNAKMMLASAQRASEDCHCQSPFDGILVSRSIDRYQTVSPGMPTVRVARIDRLEATIAIPESEAFVYSEGMKTSFHTLQKPDKLYEGTLASLDRAVDARSRTATARIIVINADGSLKPGMVGRTKILRKSFENTVIIPATALIRLQNSLSVMVVENYMARQRIVTIGASTNDSTVVLSGLTAGEKLIVSGGFQVTEGTRVVY